MHSLQTCFSPRFETITDLFLFWIQGSPNVTVSVRLPSWNSTFMIVTLQVRGMYKDRHYKGEECTRTDITRERNVMMTDVTSERKVQGMDIKSESNVKGMNITLMDITSHCLLSSSQEPSKCLLSRVFFFTSFSSWEARLSPPRAISLQQTEEL